MISISFSLAKDDVVALACHYYTTSATLRRSRLSSQVAVPVLLALIGLLMVVKGDQLRSSGIGLLICAGAAVAGIPFWYRWSLRKTAERMIDEPSYRKVFGNYTLVFNEEGIASTSPTGEGKYTWEAVDRVFLTPEYLFIMLVGAQGFSIPRSQIPDSTIQEMKAFAESHARGLETTVPSNPGLHFDGKK